MTSDHGTAATYDAGCHCVPCRQGNNRRVKLWNLRTRHGAVPVRVDLAPVRTHVVALRETGWTLKEIADEAGISWHTVKAITANTSSKRSLTRAVADRVLSVQPLTPVDVDTVVVERLMAGADWRAIGATRAERIAAAERLPVKADVERHLGLHVGRDYTPRSVAS